MIHRYRINHYSIVDSLCGCCGALYYDPKILITTVISVLKVSRVVGLKSRKNIRLANYCNIKQKSLKFDNRLNKYLMR